MYTDAEMFEWSEKQRALATPMSNAELAWFLLNKLMGSVSRAESEYATNDEDVAEYAKQRGALREAALRLAGIREFQKPE